MSKIDPIFVYDQHQSPVSALAFGHYSQQQPVLVSGSNDGELHVWRLTDFAGLIKIQVHQSKVLGLQCLDGGSVGGPVEARSEKINEKMNENTASKQMNENPLNDPAGEEPSSLSRPVNCGLRIVSQEKNGRIKFVCLFRAANEGDMNEAIIKWRVYNELSCSSCTFCPFQALTIGSRLLLACVSAGSSNCVNLVVMNEKHAHRNAHRNVRRNERCNEHRKTDSIEDRTDAPDDGNQDNCDVLLNERIVQIDQTLGMISSMRMRTYDDRILLLIGTETGSCLLYTGDWDGSWIGEDKKKQRKVEHRFTLKYQQQCFDGTFISSVELDVSCRLDLSDQRLRLICGSIEDCLAVLDLVVELSDDQPSDSENSQVKPSVSNEPPQQGCSQGERQPPSLAKPKLICKPQASFRNKETAKPVKYLKITNKGINSIAGRPDGKLVASGGSDGRVRLFSLKSLKALAVLAFHKQTIETIKFSAYLTEHKGHLLAAAGQDKLVTVWSVYNG